MTLLSPNVIFPADNSWTLSQFKRKEFLDEWETINHVVKSRRTSTSKEAIYVCASIRLVSPIITVNPNDPFALMEVCEDGTDQSCIVILRGLDALTCHTDLVPGDVVQLLVHRIRWNIQQRLSHRDLQSHIPSHVFLILKATELQRYPRSSTTHGTSVHTITPPPSSDNTTATTATTTTTTSSSIKGTITKCNLVRLPQQHAHVTIIHSIQLEHPSSTGTASKLLYLTYYPMSLDTQHSLVPGASIVAYNVALLCPNTYDTKLDVYTATLRSTISVTSACQQAQHPTDCRASMISWNWSRIRRTYKEYLVRERTRRWLIAGQLASTTSAKKIDEIVSLVTDMCIHSVDNVSKSNDSFQTQQKSKKRDPYAEFFLDTNSVSATISTSSARVIDTNHDMEQVEGAGATRVEHNAWPVFMRIDDIQSISMHLLRTRLRRYLQRTTANNNSSSTIWGGWTASVFFTAADILERWATMDDHSLDLQSALYIGGRVCSESENMLGPLLMKDIESRIPISCPTLAKRPGGIGDYLVCKIERVVVSSVCFSCPKEAACVGGHPGSSAPFTKLKTPANDITPSNDCFVLNESGLLFVATVQIIYDNHCCVASDDADARLAVGPRSPTAQQANRENPTQSTVIHPSFGIQECLQHPNRVMGSKGSTILGLAVRKRFRYSKPKASTGKVQNCTLTLSHACDGSKLISSEPSTLQSVDVKIITKRHVELREVLRHAISQVIDKWVVVSDKITLACSWWIFAKNINACALTVGGWDDCLNDGNGPIIATKVSLPETSLFIGRRGYVRFECESKDLKAYFCNVSSDTGDCSTSRCSQNCLDYIARRNFFNGTLDSRPRRLSTFRRDGGRIVGELQQCAEPTGVILLTIRDMFGAICSDIRQGKQCHLAPSLVRGVRNAHFLGITFCQARCVCFECLQPLSTEYGGTTGITQSAYEGTVWSLTRDIDDPLEQKSFWHLPSLSQHGESGREHWDSTAPVKNVMNDAISLSKLRCGNDCSLKAYSILWECSGVVDDGTGQAKLYAERECAITLLGIEKSVVEQIEAGIWFSKKGVIEFCKARPPSEALRKNIRLTFHCKKGTKDWLKDLSLENRAEYLMQYHCRASPSPRRRLDYFVRCKPLSDDASNLGHTNIETSFMNANGLMQKMDMPTYTMPPLKLQLVDCAVPS